MGILFCEGSGLNDSIFGKSQAPIKMFLEKKNEAYEEKSMIKELFHMDKSSNFAETFTSLTATNGFQPVGENGAYPQDESVEGYKKLLTHVTWKDSFAISREMVDDAKLIDMKKAPANFISGYHRTRELFAAALFGGAISREKSVKFRGKTFDTTSADKKCLFDTEHPSILDKGKQSNCFADAFSNDALMAAETAMQNFKGDNGEVLNLAPDTIVIPNLHSLKKEVFAAIGADKDPATANNGFNYNFGRWNVVIWPYLNQFIKAGTTPWFLADSEYNEEAGGALWLDRVALEITSEKADNDANVWKGYSRFTAGFNDWRAFIAGGIADGSALPM